jgi:competence protein ComFC
VFKFILSVLYPERCVSCNSLKCGYLCTDCFSRVTFHVSYKCPVCLKPSIDGRTHSRCQHRYDIVGLVSAVDYGSVVRKLVLRFKYKPYLSDLKTIIGKLFIEGLEQNELFFYILKQEPLFLPIPLSKRRMNMRGYNQSQLLASYVAQYFEQKMNDKVLLRVKETRPQYKLDRSSRFANIKNAFLVNPKFSSLIKNKSIVLIDDVATTCSTLREAARTLKRAGSGDVYGVTFAQEL